MAGMAVRTQLSLERLAQSFERIVPNGQFSWERSLLFRSGSLKTVTKPGRLVTSTGARHKTRVCRFAGWLRRPPWPRA